MPDGERLGDGSAAAAYALVRDRLDLVERAIEEAVRSDIPLVHRIAEYLHRTGGKRLRPALVLLCARACGYKGDADVELGAIVEFIHTATLLHDDIIDEATVRRGRITANRVWGNDLAVLLGDYIYVRSMAMSVQIGDLRLVEILTATTTRLVEGEILDVAHNGNSRLTEATYLDMIDRKTASLFAFCCQAAAVLAGAPEAQERALRRYGRNLGMAFQLIDDVLDYSADPERLGKRPGTDLREGKVTLPLIYLLRRASPEVRELALGCLADPGLAEDRLRELVEAMEAEGFLAATRGVAERYAERARQALQGLAASPAHEALAALPDFVLARRH